MHIPKNLVLGCPCAPTWVTHLGLLRPQRLRKGHPARLRDRDGRVALGGRMAPQQLAALRLLATIARHWRVDPVGGRQAAGPRGRAPVVDPGQQVLGIPRHAGVGRLREVNANGRATWSREATRPGGLHRLLAIGIFVVFPRASSVSGRQGPSQLGSQPSGQRDGPLPLSGRPPHQSAGSGAGGRTGRSPRSRSDPRSAPGWAPGARPSRRRAGRGSGPARHPRP